MSKGYRDGAFALGLVVGGGLALNLFLWLDYRTQSKVAEQPQASQNDQYSEVGRYWDGLIGTFVSPSDTLAQWVMAFFTIAATGVLVLTLRSANKTNIAAVKASEAALEANSIMRDEQRPWVTITRDLNCEFVDFGAHTGRITWNFNLINKGKTPAYAIEKNVKLFKSEYFYECVRHIDEFTNDCLRRRGGNRTAIIFADAQTDFVAYESSSSNTYNLRPNENGIMEKSIQSGDSFSMLVCITYKTGVHDDAAIGVETSAYMIEEDDAFLGPWRHKLLEFGTDRIVR